MAITNLQLNVRANTARAMADFKRFSSNLDSQFLVSGLKLDVVRSALGQINREFQKSIGEQGLIGASSLRAAQNQAAMMAQIFKGFSDEASINITTQLSTALNNVAVKAGGTMKDVQRTLAATPFISKDIGEDLRLQLTKGIMTFQRDFRRAGIGDNFGGLAQQFLSGGVTGRDLISTKDPISTFLGAEIIKRSGGQGFIDNPEKRSQLLAEIVNDPKIMSQLAEMAKRAAGFRIILEDLNTQLFNTESGVFGSLKKVIDRTGKQTTMFDEVNNLVDRVFGPGGFFRSLFESISEIFKIGDPLRPLIDAVQFMTDIFGKLTSFVQSDRFKRILSALKDTFDRLQEFFTNVHRSVKEAITAGTFDPSNIVRFITDLGEGVRDYIRKIGNSIRERDDTEEMGFVAEIGVTLLTEVGKTAIVLVKELLTTLIDKAPEIATSVLPALNKGINSLLTEAFGEVGGKIVKFIAGFIPGVGPFARASAIGDVTGGGGNMFSALAMGAGAMLGPGALFGGASLLRRLGTSRGRFGMLNQLGNQAMGLETSFNRRFLLDDPLTGVNRFSPLSRGIIDPLSNQIRPLSTNYRYGPSSVLPPRSVNPNYFPSSVNPFYGPSSVLPPRSPWHQRIRLPGYQVGGPFSNLGRITPESSMFNRLYGGYMTPQERFMQGEGLRRRKLIQRGMINVPERIGGRFSILGRLTPESSMFTPRASGGRPAPRGQAVTQQYTSVIGPQPHNYEWAYDPSYRAVSQGGDYAPYIPSSVITPRERLIQAQAARRRRMVRGFGRAALVGGTLAGVGALGIGLIGGPGAQAAQSGQAVGSVLSGGMEGAMLGATIGSIVPGVGTAAGAVIGGVIGGVAPLMDKGVREGIEQFISNIRIGFEESWTWFNRKAGEIFTWAGKGIETAFKGFVNGFIAFLNTAISSATLIPRTIAQMVQSIWNEAPDWVKDKVPGAGDLLGKAVDITSFQIPYFYSGKNFAGPALALEARMSGRNPMVVNDGEFVIPSGGFATLASLVGQNLRSRDVVRRADGPTQVNVNLTVQTSAFYANADQIARELRQPVIDIIDQAWTEYADSQRVIRSKTT
jgi:hypothetical protein